MRSSSSAYQSKKKNCQILLGNSIAMWLSVLTLLACNYFLPLDTWTAFYLPQALTQLMTYSQTHSLNAVNNLFTMK